MEQTLFQPFMENALSLNWSEWVTAVATLVLAVVTIVYVILTKRILSAQSDPCVILTVVHDEDRSTVLQLVVRNVGMGLAHDIRFEFSRPLPAKAWGITPEEAEEPSKMIRGPLIDGIPALGPGECRKVDWGQFGGLMAAVGNEPIVATCKFKKNGQQMLPTRCPLDVASFIDTIAVESPQAKIADALGRISKDIRKYVS